mgnify:CR=1 FL=1
MSIVKLNNRGVKDATAFGSITGLGNLVFISRSTASSSASLSITSGLTSTYKEYIFVFNNIHASANAKFTFQASTDSGSNYNTTCTSSAFGAAHNEAGSFTQLAYSSGSDAAQSTSFIPISVEQFPTDNDDSYSGYLNLFEPSSTTFTKHFISSSAYVSYSSPAKYVGNDFIAGYFNTTSAIDAMQFKMSSGNIDAGTIDMYGVA